MKSDVQTNVFKFRVAANITEYHNISKLIFRRRIINIIPKFMMIRQLFNVKTRMTAFTKAKLKKLDDPTNFDN